MRRTILTIVAVSGIIASGCMKNDTMSTSGGNQNLKDAMTTGVTAINSAASTISASKAYEVLSANTVGLKSTATFTDSVTLASIAGIYDFKPDLVHFFDFYIPHRLFVKTGTSNILIVNLPQKLVFHPRSLREIDPPDSLLKNDFTIKATDYYYFFNFNNLFNYRLTAGLTLDSTNLGNMQIMATADQTKQSYTSSFDFPSGYTINASLTSNDTVTRMFSLMKGTDLLLKETVISTPVMMGTTMGSGDDKDDFIHRERLYILDIGNVEIKRGAGLDSIQVFVGGVLQKHAGAKMVDSTGTDGSILNKRDIKLTFDDGTTTTVNELIAPAKDALKTLSSALHSMNFAKNIVDYIAIGIDFDDHHRGH